MALEQQERDFYEDYYFYDSESIIGKKVEKEIIFKEVTYFLASLGVRIEHNYVASFGFGAVYPPAAYNGDYGRFRSNGHEFDGNFAVRPILYLKPNEAINSLLNGKKDKTSNIRVTILEVKNLLNKLEEKRQEEEKIIRQIEELIK